MLNYLPSIIYLFNLVDEALKLFHFSYNLKGYNVFLKSDYYAFYNI